MQWGSVWPSLPFDSQHPHSTGLRGGVGLAPLHAVGICVGRDTHKKTPTEKGSRDCQGSHPTWEGAGPPPSWTEQSH